MIGMQKYDNNSSCSCRSVTYSSCTSVEALTAALHVNSQ
jgi:hypothetical protein